MAWDGGDNESMFLKPCYRGKNGKRHAYWALVESYRTARGPRHRVVAYLGQVNESKRLGMKQAAGGTASLRYSPRRPPSDPAATSGADIALAVAGDGQETERDVVKTFADSERK